MTTATWAGLVLPLAVLASVTVGLLVGFAVSLITWDMFGAGKWYLRRTSKQD